jgi:hypothetical protein
MHAWQQSIPFSATHLSRSQVAPNFVAGYWRLPDPAKSQVCRDVGNVFALGKGDEIAKSAVHAS